jgi:predicted RecA/RadA family phage recombinase
MKNFQGPGDVMTLIAPAGGVTSGVAVLVGALVVVPVNDAAAGAAFQARTDDGVFVNQKKAAGAAWTAGQVLYFDSADSTFKTATGATARRAAVASADAAAGDLIGTIKLVNVCAPVNVA